MKVKMFQSGGANLYTPVYIPTAEEAQTSEMDKEYQKYILKLLDKQGLANDKVEFSKAVANLMSGGSDSVERLLNSGSSNMLGKLIQLSTLANNLTRGQDSYNKAQEQIQKEHAGSEIAITNDGKLWALKDGTLTTISASEYSNKKDASEYQLLTNNDLLWQRENAQSEVFNDRITNCLQNAVGMESVVNYVKGIITAYGKEVQERKSSSYITKEQATIADGMAQLLGNAPDGLYKSTQSQKITSELKGPEGVKTALEYIYKALPQNMKHLLRATTAAENLDPNNPNDVYRLLALAIHHHTDELNESSLDLDFKGSTSGSGSGSGSGGGLREVSREEDIVQGRTVLPVPVTLQASNSRGAITAVGQQYGQPRTSNGEIINGSIQNVFNKDVLFNSVQQNSVSFAGQVLKTSDLHKIVYDGSSQITRMVLPVDMQVKNTTGKIVPDLDAAKRFEKFMNWYRAKGSPTSNECAAKLQEFELDVDPTYPFNFRNTHVFLTLTGIASDKFVDFDSDSGWAVPLERDSEMFDWYANMTKYGAGQRESKSQAASPFGVGREWLTFGEDSSLYRGTIYMPLADAGIATVTTNGSMAPKENWVDIYNKRSTQELKTNF